MVVTHSPPTTKIDVEIPVQPRMEKLVDAYSLLEFIEQILNQLYVLVSSTLTTTCLKQYICTRRDTKLNRSSISYYKTFDLLIYFYTSLQRLLLTQVSTKHFIFQCSEHIKIPHPELYIQKLNLVSVA